MTSNESSPLPAATADDALDQPDSYAIRRVREVVAVTAPIHHAVAATPEPPVGKANITWQLHVWSGPPRRGRALGMAEMGGPREARPNDGERARK